MNDRFKFRIVVFERNYEPKTDWKFVEIIEDNNNWHLTMCGDIASNDCYYAHYRRNNAPDNVCRVYEPVFCTGLKDKNGTLIYEGDIINIWCKNLTKNQISEVKFCEERAAFTFDYITDFGNIVPCTMDKTEIEVIGNIYENAELLEE